MIKTIITRERFFISFPKSWEMQNIIDQNYAKRYFNVAKFDIRNNFEVKLGVSFNPFKLWTRVQLPASFLNYQTVRIGSLLFHSRVWKYARERATTTYIATAWLIDRNNGGHPSPLQPGLTCAPSKDLQRRFDFARVSIALRPPSRMARFTRRHIWVFVAKLIKVTWHFFPALFQDNVLQARVTF